jgi:hypothetical protein
MTRRALKKQKRHVCESKSLETVHVCNHSAQQDSTSDCKDKGIQEKERNMSTYSMEED